MNCCGKKQKLLECSICLETNQNIQIRKLKCNHKFHMNCIEEWLKMEKRCPLCNNYTVPFKEELMNDLKYLPNKYKHLAQIYLK